MPNTKSPQKTKKPKQQPIKTGMRVPRPLGLTYLSLQLQKENNQELKQKLKKETQRRIIQQYVANGMMLNNKLYSVNDIAQLLELPIIIVIREMNKATSSIAGLMDDMEGKQFARGLISQALLKSLEYQALTEAQAKQLLHEQGGRYVPFLTSEVNKAIGNLQGAQKPVLEIIKMITEANPKAIRTGDTEEDALTKKQYLTPDMALQTLTQNRGTLLSDEAYLIEKEQELRGLPGLPEVDADKQHFDVKTNRNITENIQPDLLPKEVDGHHESRRERQFGTIDNIDDFMA